jgi:hypothetical protein
MANDQAAVDEINRLAAERDAAQDPYAKAESAAEKAIQKRDAVVKAADEATKAGLPIDPEVIHKIEAELATAIHALNAAFFRFKDATAALDKAARAAGIEPPHYGKTIGRGSEAPPLSLDQQIEEKSREGRFKRLHRDAERAAKGESPAHSAIQDEVQRVIDESPPIPLPWKRRQSPPTSPNPPEHDLATEIETKWNQFIKGVMPPDEAAPYRKWLIENKDLLPDPNKDYLQQHPELLKDPIGEAPPREWPGYLPTGVPPVVPDATLNPSGLPADVRILPRATMKRQDILIPAGTTKDLPIVPATKPRTISLIGCAVVAVLLIAVAGYEGYNHFFAMPAAGGGTLKAVSTTLTYHHIGSDGTQTDQTETLQVQGDGAGGFVITHTRQNPAGTLITKFHLDADGDEVTETAYTFTGKTGDTISHDCLGGGVNEVPGTKVGATATIEANCPGTAQNTTANDKYNGVVTVIGTRTVTVGDMEKQAEVVEMKFTIVTSSSGQADITQTIHEQVLYIVNPFEEAYVSAYETITGTSSIHLSSLDWLDGLNSRDWLPRLTQ